MNLPYVPLTWVNCDRDPRVATSHCILCDGRAKGLSFEDAEAYGEDHICGECLRAAAGMFPVEDDT